MNSTLETVIQTAKDLSSRKPTHDWQHTLRVKAIARRIASKEQRDLNLEILDLAVYLHDISRQEEDDSSGSVDHAKLGATKAKEILTSLNYPENTIQQVIHCIEAHRFRKNEDDQRPKSVEAEILFDADKIDCIGAVGVARSFLYAGENGYQLFRPLPPTYNGASRNKDPKVHTANIEYEVKLKFIKNILFTDEGKRIAEFRHNFMAEFFTRLEDEVEGRS